ncbi:MAG TPA: energy transducer TonB [Paludibacter sp.]|nr:energy transducer TonB [Paludibacter sp.]
MTAKKSAQANLENKKSIYLMIGFVMVLSLLFIFLEWSKKDVKVFVQDQPTIEIPDEFLIPITMVAPPPPPPPPVLSPEIINIVDDDIPTEIVDFTSDDNPDIGVDLTPVVYGNGPIEVISDEPVIYAEIMPRFNGDVNDFLSKNIKYPSIAIETYTQGKVVCQFVINRDGSIVDVEVVRSVDPSLDKEAMRVIKLMPKWQPGIQNGKPVRVKYYLPVYFKLM